MDRYRKEVPAVNRNLIMQPVVTGWGNMAQESCGPQSVQPI
jgi:hypothetical protein